MKAVVAEKIGADPEVREVEKPVPESDQLLVKPLYMALTPVDAFMINTGMLVQEWPMTIGAEGCGVVVDLGKEAAALGFEKGDYVCGCIRLGTKGHAVTAEYHLRQAEVAMRKPKNLSVAEAAVIGAGFQTAALGLDLGLEIPLPQEKSAKVGEWVLVQGGAGSVGFSAVQLLLCAGYDVVATCSSRSKDGLEALGAVTVDYKQSDEAQIKSIQEITNGRLSKIFDAASSMDPTVARKLLENATGTTHFTTTMDWGPITGFEKTKVDQIELGPIGSPGYKELNARAAKYNPIVVKLFEAGLLKPSDYDVVEEGLEGAIKAYEYHKAGRGGNRRVLVKIQDE